jgi:predicted phosphoadenosine phosphosulfate sulfurtransferase
VLLRNDYWCKGLGQTQPKSEAWEKFKTMRKKDKAAQKIEPDTTSLLPFAAE